MFCDLRGALRKNKRIYLRALTTYLQQRMKGAEKDQEVIDGEMDLLTWGKK